ncbi:MAG: protein tyrosine phosphatase [Pseudomonadota bacterium]
MDAYRTPAGRRRAWRELMLGDHGALREFYDNSHTVVPGKVWRSYQPSPSHLARWKERGVRTIVNLRGDKPSGFLYLEREACERLGLNLETIRAYSREAPPKDFLHELRALYRRIDYPALLHCKSGADRAGVASVLYLFFEEGRPLDEAMDHLSFRYGHVRQGKTGVIDVALKEYIEHARAAGHSLKDVDAFFRWVDGPYDPAKIKRDFKPNVFGRLLSDVVLRRE